MDEHWATAELTDLLRTGTRARYGQIFDSFRAYAAASGAGSPDRVHRGLCERFLTAPLSSGRSVCPATSRLRLTVIRGAFDVLMIRGLVPTNPAACLKVSVEREPLPLFPLTPSEANRVVLTGRSDPRDLLRPATVVLALSGASHTEIAAAVISDLDIGAQRVRLGKDGAQRLQELTSVQVRLLTDRITDQRRSWRRREVQWDSEQVPLALNRPLTSYPVNSVAPTVNQNLARALHHAGITRRGVRPKSFRHYAANRTYALTGNIELVASQLAISSLDTAVRLIDRQWQQRWGLSIRETVANGG